MSSSGFTAEVTNLSSKATKKDVHKFFNYCGPIQKIEILREGKPDSRAYVTFKDFLALETSIVLTGSVIVDQPVEITPHDMPVYTALSHPGEAVVLATEVVKTMADQGYTLSNGAYQRAKAFDDSYRVSAKAATAVAQAAKTAASAASAVANSTIVAKGVSAASAVANSTIVAKGASTASSAASAVVNSTVAVVSSTASTASSAASAVVNGTVAVVNSNAVATGALLLSGVFGFASKAASDFGKRNRNGKS